MFLNIIKIKSRITTRLLMYFMLTTLIMVLASVYTYSNTKLFLSKIDDMFNTSIDLNELRLDLKSVEVNLFEYLKNPVDSNEYLNQYMKSRDNLEYKANYIKSKYKSNLILKDISNMSFSYLDETKLAESAKRGRNIDQYSAHYDRSKEILGYIDFYIEELSLQYFENDTNFYKSISGKLKFVQEINILLIIVSVFINILLVIIFTMRLRKPIITLSKSAKEISKGNFNVQEVVVDTNDEMKIMASAFNKMVLNLKTHVDDIKEKAKLEKQLNEKEVQNLEIKNLLKEAELISLQSQINPHFLFNTLNAGMQIAMFEGAERTSDFIENVSNMLRYNLRKLNEPVKLKDEINNALGYIYILKTRFKDRLNFISEINDLAENIDIPCLIIQPILENAFIHGISELESGGLIKLIVKEEQKNIYIIIEDNGRGIRSEVLKKIQSKNFTRLKNEKLGKGHISGIGMVNVIKRLEIFYNSSDIFRIESVLGEYTKIILKLPVK
ncbi:MAG: histidine kinase [Clostridiales bacterium]